MCVYNLQRFRLDMQQNPGTLNRSRSREQAPPTFVGRPAVASLPPGLERPQELSHATMIAQLLHEQKVQNRLMEQQLQLLQMDKYSDPNEILPLVDPELKSILLEWANSFKSTLQQSLTQDALQQKYLAIERSGELQRQFSEECKKSWQWPLAFKAHARELQSCTALLGEGDVDMFVEDADHEVPFDITQAYLNLRKRHARECQDFVVSYQRQCTAFFASQVKPQVQLQKLVDTTTAWIHKNRTVLPEYAIASIKQHVRNYADLTFRKEVPKARSRIEKEQANKTKQEQALLEAESEFRLMDVNRLLALPGPGSARILSSPVREWSG